MKNHTVDAPSSTDIFTSDFMIGNVGTPFVMGLAVGYFAKKNVAHDPVFMRCGNRIAVCL